MVGLVIVSHSKKLAEATRTLVLQMTTPEFPVAVAAGVGDTHDEIGTDAVHIADVLANFNSAGDVLVLMDLGSAVLSAQTALELLDPAVAGRVRLCSGPLVEGAIAAAVCAQGGGTLDDVAREAETGLAPKQQQLQPASTATPAVLTVDRARAHDGEAAELELEILNPHGLHARPAAALVQLAARYTSNIDVFNVTCGRGPGSARSLTSLALLQVRRGDRIKVRCIGEDRELALGAVRKLAASNFNEAIQPTCVIAPPRTKAASEQLGYPASDGIAIGPLTRLASLEIALDDRPPKSAAAEELARLTEAMNEVAGEIVRDQPMGNDILEAQALILADPVILKQLKSAVQDVNVSAERAWSQMAGHLAEQYEAMDDSHLRERASDIRDIARRVLRRLQGDASAPAVRLARPAIVFAEELLPSEAASCDPASVLGVITAKGSATSHSAILLRSLGIPMVVGAGHIVRVKVGSTVALDGATGEIWIEPDAQTVNHLRDLQQLQVERRRQAERLREQPCTTSDGTHIEILANASNAEESRLAAQSGAAGIGLLRTEFLFVSRREMPTEDEQVAALREIYSGMRGPIIVRTLDAGADKPLTFAPQPREDNPYLGIRGLRLSLRTPEIFLTHLRAILRSGDGHDVWIMFPMVSVLQEVNDALRFLDVAHEQLAREGIPHPWPLKRGIMIEVPSAALMTERLAERVDFFSIGTNDLTQYTMAAERGNTAVSELLDALHPAVLRLIRSVVDGASGHNRHVSVCGDSASDPVAAAMLVGLGIRSLSARPRQIAEIKATLRRVKLSELQRIARQALDCGEAAEAHKLIRQYLETEAATHRYVVGPSLIPSDS